MVYKKHEARGQMFYKKRVVAGCHSACNCVKNKPRVMIFRSSSRERRRARNSPGLTSIAYAEPRRTCAGRGASCSTSAPRYAYQR